MTCAHLPKSDPALWSVLESPDTRCDDCNRRQLAARHERLRELDRQIEKGMPPDPPIYLTAESLRVLNQYQTSRPSLVTHGQIWRRWNAHRNHWMVCVYLKPRRSTTKRVEMRRWQVVFVDDPALQRVPRRVMRAVQDYATRWPGEVVRVFLRATDGAEWDCEIPR